MLAEVSGEAEVVSEAERQLKELLRKQLNTSACSSIQGFEQQDRKFVSAITYQPLGKEVEGLKSLEQYQSARTSYNHVDVLRQDGLSEKDIDLLKNLQCTTTGADECQRPTKRARYGTEPLALKAKLEAIKQKMEGREQVREQGGIQKGIKALSRHAMEVERSLFLGSETERPLQHLIVESSKRNYVSYPTEVLLGKEDNMMEENIMQVVGRLESGKKNEKDGDKNKNSDSSFDNGDDDKTAPPHPPAKVEVNPLPPQVIERHRLTECEIRALPRFHKYTPGSPSPVLFVKNLHPKISEEDLEAIFGSCDGLSCVRLMKGRMRGQAFVTFTSTEAAAAALQRVNGFTVHDKPLVICYGRHNNDNPPS